MEYVGEILNRNQFQDRVKEAEELHQRHFYFMTIRKGEIIDASKKGNLARFMNHSCNPNCETQKWTVNGKLRVGLFAKRHIKAGSELTFDYKFVRFGHLAQQCYCGESNCKGIIGEDAKEKDVDLLGPDLAPASDEIEDIIDPDTLITVGQIPRIVKALLKSDSSTKTSALLQTILRADSADCYQQFIHFHGLKVLAALKLSDEILDAFLKVLHKLPISNRRQVEDSGIESVVNDINSNQNIDSLKSGLLHKWSALSTEYHIPHVPSTPDIQSIGLNEVDDPYSLDVPEKFKRQPKSVASVQTARTYETRAPRQRPPQVAAPHRETPPTQGSPDLPPHWRSTTSPEGQIYYYNEITKETSWDLPRINRHPSSDSLSFAQVFISH
jgi:hypothetical protein